ncbi:hypothetical protein TNCV_2347731 [Trichonephila clavipes]|nr:hypothetical protein TNCV_2347731 [Trichonephila clavipes]
MWMVNKKLVIGVNCKQLLALTVRGERRLRRIVRRQRSQTLVQITTQLNDSSSPLVSKQTMQNSLHRMDWGAVHLRVYHCSVLNPPSG